MSTLDQLIQVQRDTLSILLKYQCRFNSKNLSELTPGYLHSLAQRVDDVFNNFEGQHSEILQKIHDDGIKESDVPYLIEDLYFEFSEQYFTFKGKIMDILPRHSVTYSPLSSTFVTPSGRADTTIGVDAKLPKISLPTFSGDYMEWIPFRDIYISLVHNNESLTKIQKFYYLKGTLAGEAKGLIKTISLTEANYDSAWSTLESRYHNKRMIVGHLVGKLFNIGKSDGGFHSIKTLLDSTKECLSSLTNLGISTQSWDPFLIHLIAQKLDVQTRRDWEQSLKSSTEIPSRSEMFDFLEKTFRTLESLQDDFSSANKQKVLQQHKGSTKHKKASVHSGNFAKPSPMKCIYCEKTHSLSKCFKFLALSLPSKNEFVSSKDICRNCLSIGHRSGACGSPFRCIICKKTHHTVLHPEEPAKQNQDLKNLPFSSRENSDVGLRVTSHGISSFKSVLLYTIRLYVRTDRGQFPVRALLDPGSQCSLITESAVQLLGLRKYRSHCRVIGIGDECTNLSKFSVKVELLSRKNNSVVNCLALVLTSLTSYTPEPSSRYISLPDIGVENLADPFFYKSDRIDMILGSDICSKVKIPTESFIHNDLYFQNTYFGWVFSGSSNATTANRVHIHNTNLENILRSFWEQEEVGSSKRGFSDEESHCESHFKVTTKRTDSGRYMVQLPFRTLLFDNVLPELNNNVVNAFKRLRQLEISFSKRPSFADSYKSFMAEYETLGHMSKVGTYPRDIRKKSYFLPHHGVFKESSTTTKLRVVFDGSSHMKDFMSLNETLSPGPALQNDLPTVMTQWRKHSIAFCADIEKMFRQIDICPSHRRFQQILWRYDPFDEIGIYELNTVTYGTTSAPYLAIRVLKELAQDYASNYPLASHVILTDSYVDDILSGAESLKDASLLYAQLCTLLEKGGCKLRKWISNCKALLDQIPEDYRDPSLTLDFARGNTVKTLGIQWNTSDDCFSFRIDCTNTKPITKRTILSDTASIYDPLGWLTPSTVMAKSLFKTLWENNLDWDDEVPDSIRNKWLKYRTSLPELAKMKIPRWIHWSSGSKTDLHCFCDASTTAYAAVVYSRIESVDGIFVNILQAKSKVTPIKTVTIPRLELCAATLLVELTEKVKQALTSLTVGDIYYWSDSSTVLSWIRKPPSTWNLYVANRVAQIQRRSNPLDWRYVPSALNPSDCASRGISPVELIENETWLYGPQFLRESPSFWPNNLSNLYTSEEQSKSKVSSHTTKLLSYPNMISRFSKLQSLLRVTALCLRFAYNCKNPNQKQTNALRLPETNRSLILFVKLTQMVDFPEELLLLTAKGELKNNRILKLMPFLDENGIIRVGGRLQNSSLPYEAKHPMLLSKTNPLAKLIILDSHEKTLHGGVTLTMSYVNRKFWIISGNTLAKTIIQRCIRCFKYTAKTSQQIMGNLPSVRLNISRPFKHSGVDYAGPIPIKTSALRSASTAKGYICLFICMVTKAIHLEAVSALTTNAFLAAFRRFTSRRGVCTDLYSDCGTNFVGASKELQVLYHKAKRSLPEDLDHALSTAGTNWHFIPPASPNFGGLWEAGVKSTKYHLKRVMNDRGMHFEELSTLLCQIESCLNSRPLAPLSSDPTDYEALTPAHFLIGEPTTCIPEESLLDSNTNILTRWKYVEKLKQHFWKRWRNEYLNRLQARPKWLRAKKNAEVGDLVLIADERCGPGQWLLGRIHETHPGQDGNR